MRCVEDEIDYAYLLVARDLERRILSGELRFGMMLSIRGELMHHYGRSERTIRAAVDLLADPEREGGALVKKLPGAGTYVSWRKPSG